MCDSGKAPGDAGKPIHPLPHRLLEGASFLACVLSRRTMGKGYPSLHRSFICGSDSAWEDTVTLCVSQVRPVHPAHVHTTCTHTHTHTHHSIAVCSCQRFPLKESTFNDYCYYCVNVYPFFSPLLPLNLPCCCLLLNLFVSQESAPSGLESGLGSGGWERGWEV